MEDVSAGQPKFTLEIRGDSAPIAKHECAKIRAIVLHNGGDCFHRHALSAATSLPLARTAGKQLATCVTWGRARLDDAWNQHLDDRFARVSTSSRVVPCTIL